MGTITRDSVDIYCHTSNAMYDNGGSTMSDYGTYRVKAKCMVIMYQDITCDDVYQACDLAVDAVNEWRVWSFDEAEVKHVLQVERID